MLTVVWSSLLLDPTLRSLRGRRYALPALPDEPTLCADPRILCLGDGDRFQVEVAWTNFQGSTGSGRRVEGVRGQDSGLFYFFSESNWELSIKVLDGCAINGHFWVFGAATTNVGYTITVADSASGEVRTYDNPLGMASPAITDTAAFATCG